MTNKVKEHTGIPYLLTEIHLRTLILLGLNIFHNMYYTKSKIKLSHTRYLEYKIMIPLCANFIVSLSYNIRSQEKLC